MTELKTLRDIVIFLIGFEEIMNKKIFFRSNDHLHSWRSWRSQCAADWEDSKDRYSRGLHHAAA